MTHKLNSHKIIQSYLDYCGQQNINNALSAAEKITYYILKENKEEYADLLSLYVDKEKLIFPDILPSEVFQEFHKGIRNTELNKSELTHIIWISIAESNLFKNHLEYHVGYNTDEMNDLS